MMHPIPSAALDDRLGFTGTAGSGKTYNSGSAAERLLADKKRIVVPDPLGVWWGLRLAPDGKSKGFDIVIFGGPHGDLPLTEHAGALIGETAASMKESCILDLSQLGTKAAERRFMLAFLTAFYRKATGEPVHVIFDEADMWAPQKLLDRDGDAARLLGMMETIVRRGRIKGFIPWLITQRPAVLSKDVLSQVDGLVTFKLTSSQDRDAIGNWVEGQADKGQWAEIWKSLPTLERGQGVIWLPSRGILKTAHFPKKATFDSSATPKRGQKPKSGAKLKPLNLDKLKELLASVDAETKANDPKALRAQLVEKDQLLTKLKHELAAAAARKVADPAALKKAEERGFEQARRKLTGAMEAEVRKRLRATMDELRKLLAPIDKRLAEIDKEARSEKVSLGEVTFTPPAAVPVATTAERFPVARAGGSQPKPAAVQRSVPAASSGDGTLTKPQLELLTALAWWSAMGHAQPSKAQVAAIANWKVKGSHLRNRLAELKGAGLIDYPQSGLIALTPAGAAAAPAPNTGTTLIDAIRAMLTAPQLELFNALLADPSRVFSREDLAAAIGWEAKGSHLRNRLAELSALEIVRYPSKGSVALQDWVFSDVRAAA